MILIINLLVLLFGAVLQFNLGITFKKTVKQSVYKKVATLLVLDFILVLLFLVLFSFNANLIVLKIVNFSALFIRGLFYLTYTNFFTTNNNKLKSISFFILTTTFMFIFMFFGQHLGRFSLQLGIILLIIIGVLLNLEKRNKNSKNFSFAIFMLFFVEVMQILTYGVILYELVWSNINDVWLISLSFLLKTFVVYFIVDITNQITINFDIRVLFDRQSPEKMMDLILSENPNVIVLTDLNHRIIYANPRLYEVTGYKKSEVIGNTPRMFSSGLTEKKTYDEMYKKLNKEGKWEGNFVNMKKSGEIFVEQTKIVKLFDVNDVPIFYLGIKTDITKERKYLDKLKELSTYDGLTKLYRREYFINYVSEHLENNVNNTKYMLLFDIDEFKTINDVHSHLIGDKSLEHFAKILQNIFGKCGVISRFGGDEFTVYLYDLKEEEVNELINKLYETLKHTIVHHSDANFVLTSSVGVYKVGSKKTFEEIYEQADKLLYKAKREGKSGAAKNF